MPAWGVRIRENTLPRQEPEGGVAVWDLFVRVGLELIFIDVFCVWKITDGLAVTLQTSTLKFTGSGRT